LSSLLKKVTKILSIKEAEINKTIACRDDLVLFKEKVNESKNKKDRLSELREEKQTIDRNIELAKREYNDFQKSDEFLNIESVQKKSRDKKKEITTFEKKIAGMISSLSRPITKFSYLAPKETQGKLATLQNEPLEIFNHYDEYLQLFSEIKRDLVEKTIQIKDPEKTIHQVDEIVLSLPHLASNLKSLKDELIQLQSSVNSKSIKHLEELKSKTELYEKYRSENISTVEQIKNDIEEADSALIELKKKIEDQAQDITKYRYSIIRSE
jgi:chromosome segregation ATPase